MTYTRYASYGALFGFIYAFVQQYLLPFSMWLNPPMGILFYLNRAIPICDGPGCILPALISSIIFWAAVFVIYARFFSKRIA